MAIVCVYVCEGESEMSRLDLGGRSQEPLDGERLPKCSSGRYLSCVRVLNGQGYLGKGW